ncbi:hypothetical protein [Tenacibaculum litoreum]
MASTENIRMWIEQSDIDYIGHFIKACIPFNASPDIENDFR